MKPLKETIKDIIRHTLYHLLGRVLYEKIIFFKVFRSWPNFKNPRTFNEKICAYKLFDIPANANIVADKIAVRDIVAKAIGEEYLTKLYFAGEDPEAIDWQALPKSFIAKGNQGSGDEYIVIVKDKDKEDEKAFKKRMHEILKLRFGKLVNEHWYLQIKPKIIIEELLVDEKHSVPPDYKFFAFNGKVKLIFVATGRYDNDLGLSFYDTQWNKQPFSINYKIGPDIPKPKNLQAMLDLATKLAAPYQSIRVDFYNLNDETRIVFGELTLSHGSGRYPFLPDKKYDLEVGRLWNYS